MTKITMLIKRRGCNILRFLVATLVFSFTSCLLGYADGVPHQWQMGFQTPQSPVMIQVNDYHNFLLGMQTLVAAVVGMILLYIIFRFRKSRNRKASTTAHNTKLEIIWTLVPLAIILYMMYPSLKLIYFMDVVPESEMTLKAVGHQWYWSYQYPDNDKIEFESRMVPDGELKSGQLRLLSTDNPVVLPVDTTIRVVTTSDDVIHSWAMPSLGVKRDSVPGRLNEVWLRINKEGTYFGQCSELCGAGHGFMPIEIHAVSKDAFKEWVEKKKQDEE